MSRSSIKKRCRRCGHKQKCHKKCQKECQKRLRYNPFFPQNTTLGRITDDIGRSIGQILDEKVKFVGNEGFPTSQAQMFNSETADVAIVSLGNTEIENEPWWPLFTTWPFMPTAYEFIEWLLQDGGIKLLNELLAEKELFAIPAAALSCADSGWSNILITEEDQFQGLRTRAFGYYGDILTRLGAENIIINGEELAQALADNVVQFAEYANPSTDVEIGLNEVAEFMYVPGWHENIQVFYLIWQKPKWEALSQKEQVAIKDLCSANLLNSLILLAGDDADILRDLAANNRVERWEDQLLVTFQRQWNIILNDLFNSNKTFARIYTSIYESENKQSLRDEILCYQPPSRPPQRPNGTQVVAFNTVINKETFVAWLEEIALREVNLDAIHYYNEITVLTTTTADAAAMLAAATAVGIDDIKQSIGVIYDFPAVRSSLVITLTQAVNDGALNTDDIITMVQTERGETVISFAEQSQADRFSVWAADRPKGVRSAVRTNGFKLVTTQEIAATTPYIEYYDMFSQAGLNMDTFQSILATRTVSVAAIFESIFEKLVSRVDCVSVVIIAPVPGALLATISEIGYVPNIILFTERGEATFSAS